MRTRTQVLLETWKENFGGFDAAADHRAAFENEHAVACLGEVRGADEAVVSSACHHIVEGLRPRCDRARLRQHGACPLWLRSAGRCRETEGCEGKGREGRRLHEIAASGQSHC